MLAEKHIHSKLARMDLEPLASTYARDLAAILKGVRDPGQAIIVDDTQERAVVGRVIFRMTPLFPLPVSLHTEESLPTSA